MVRISFPQRVSFTDTKRRLKYSRWWSKCEGNYNTRLEQSFCRERAIRLSSRITVMSHFLWDNLLVTVCYYFSLTFLKSCVMSWNDFCFHTPLERKYFAINCLSWASVYSIILSTNLLKDMHNDIHRPITVLINRNECNSNGQRTW